MYDCGIPSSTASSTQQSEEQRRRGGGGGGELQDGWQQSEGGIEIVIMSVKGSGWPPAPPLFNNPIITGSILTGDPSAAAAAGLSAVTSTPSCRCVSSLSAPEY